MKIGDIVSYHNNPKRVTSTIEELQQKRAFVPSITCEQIAYMEFV